MTEPLAIYGAAIGSAAAVGAIWNVYHGIRDRASLKLIGVWTHRSMGPGTPYVVITLANEGRRPITIKSFGLRCADGGILDLVQIEFPRKGEWLGPIPVESFSKRLDEGEQCEFVANLQAGIPDGRFSPSSVRRLEVGDGAGKIWKFRLSSQHLQSIEMMFPKREGAM